MTKNVVTLQNIGFAYDKTPIYEDFTLEIPENDIFFLMGVNGCGKTTLLKIITSFLKVTNGEVRIDGKSVDTYDSKSLAKRIAYVPQIISLNSDFLVKDYLALGRTPYKGLYASINDDDFRLVEQYATSLGIEDLLDVSFNSLSGGQKQVVAIGRALVQETPIIIMDEPMSALDLGRQAEFLSMLLKLKTKGKTIILTSHNPNHALAIKSECSVCFLRAGKVVGIGKCEDILTSDIINKIYGDRIVLDQDDVIRFRI